MFRWRLVPVVVSLALLVSLATLMAPYASAVTVSTGWFYVTVKSQQYVILSDSLFYFVNMSLTRGLRASYWYINVSSPTLVSLTPMPNEQIATPLLGLARPNSTFTPLPGQLSETSWNASITSSENYTSTVLLEPSNSSLTYPFILHVYMTASAYEPYITYTAVITNDGNSPAWTTLVYGIGAQYNIVSNWTAAATYQFNNGTVVETLSNATELQGQVRSAAAIGLRGSEPLVSIGIAPINGSTYYVELLEGKLFGLNVSTIYVLAAFKTPLLQPGQNYTVSFKVYSIWFNPIELAAVDALPIAAYEYPSALFSNLTSALSYVYEESQLRSNISALLSQVSRLQGEVSNLSAKLYYQGVQLNNLQRSNSYYMGVAHRGGILAAGLFIAGVVVGLLGGAYLLSPTGHEVLTKRRQPQQPKKR